MAAREIALNNVMDKDKKTLTISSNLKKLTLAQSHLLVKSFSVEKKKILDLQKPFNKLNNVPNINTNHVAKKRTC